MMTLVFLHGYGSDGDEMKSAIGFQREGVRSIFMDAPQPCDLFRGKRQWFRLSYLHEYLAPQVDRQAQAVVERIAACPTDDGRRFLLVGHSQGAMLAAYIGLTGLLPGSRSICVSAMLPFMHLIQPRRDAVLTFIHGAADRMAPPEDIRRASDQLAATGVRCRMKCLAGAGHELDERLSSLVRDEIANQIVEIQNDDHELSTS